MDDLEQDDKPPVRELSRGQRRVLGTLLEKAFTTPDGYPMTLKGLTTGCNQKSNRDPVTNYSEDQIEDLTEQLRRLGLVSELHSDGGRALRYRHLVRKRFEFSEPQIAILAELWLRGRQTLGELRQRASRMVPIESLDDLRAELDGLVADGHLLASGSLDRRGVEVDHGFYPSDEAPKWASIAGDAGRREARTSSPSPSEVASSSKVASNTEGGDDLVAQIQAKVEALEQLTEELQQQLMDLKTQLGV